MKPNVSTKNLIPKQFWSNFCKSTYFQNLLHQKVPSNFVSRTQFLWRICYIPETEIVFCFIRYRNIDTEMKAQYFDQRADTETVLVEYYFEATSLNCTLFLNIFYCVYVRNEKWDITVVDAFFKFPVLQSPVSKNISGNPMRKCWLSN